MAHGHNKYQFRENRARMRMSFLALIGAFCLPLASASLHADPTAYEFISEAQAKTDGVSLPIRLTGGSPYYPVEARKNLQEGDVLLHSLIGVDGKIAGMSILSSSGSPALDEAAVNFVRQSVYQPAMRNGVPIPIRMKMRFNFKISQFMLDEMKAHPERYR